MSQDIDSAAIIKELEKENRDLLEVLDLNTSLSSSIHLETILDSLIEKAKLICEAEAGSLMLFDEVNQVLYFHTIKLDKNSESLKDVRLKLGDGIAGWAAKTKESVLIEDCLNDSRFYRGADKLSKFKTRTMMCAPLIARSNVLGTIQIINHKRNKTFSKKNLYILDILATQAAIAVYNAKLHKMATVDSLTGLYMKHYLLSNMKQEYKKAKHNNTALSLFMSDIDLFKKVNDEHGHQGGDAALVELARIMRDIVHSKENQDMAGRYGGEEFAVLLPGKDENEALNLAEQIREKIESTPIIIGDKKVNITISIGVSSYPLHDNLIEKAEDFVKLSDNALYQCKANGRNCVTIYKNT